LWQYRYTDKGLSSFKEKNAMDGTVLIMDYSAYERQKVRHILDKIGSFNIVEVGGIGQFMLLDLDFIDAKLVLLDLSFPTENDGFSALRRIRASDIKNVPVIVVSRSDKHDLKTQALSYSVNDYIVKPYQVKRLESSIRSFIRITSNFHYNTSNIEDIRMSFDDYVEREIKYSKRTRNPLSFILITTLQLQNGSEGEVKPGSENAALIYSIAVQKAKESLRATDMIVLSNERDVIIVLPCTNEAGAKLVCEKISAQMEPELERINASRNEYIYPVYVTYPKDGDSFQLLMETAFKKVSDKEMLEKIVSIPTGTRNYADRSYSKYNRYF
jgi:PleD family two-component response regulator